MLTEKPLDPSTEKCRAVLDAAQYSSAKLMVAYRLHFEPATLDAIDKIRSVMLGEVHLFASIFSQFVDPDNHRVKHGRNAGPIFDMGPYPVNAARYFFEDEPTEFVSAVGTTHPASDFPQGFYDTVAVTLRFPNNRLAQFNLSYFGGSSHSALVIGTRGTLQLDSAYVFGEGLTQIPTIGEKKSRHSFKNTDHFGGELKYFSACILNDEIPEPDGEEGYADVRVLERIVHALSTGGAVTLPPFNRTRRIDTARQKMTLDAVTTPELVHASNPTKGSTQKSTN